MENTTRAFTLTEILVVIAVIGILGVSISRLNFSRISQQELIAIETIKILAGSEEMRNNALVGKAVDINGQIPESWFIEFDDSNNSYSTSYSGGTLQTQVLRNPFEILNLTCGNLDRSITATGATIQIDFLTTGQTTITGCPASVGYPKILDIEIGRGDIVNTIRINTLSNVIEEI